MVVPFNIACGSCFMCEQGLQSQCETTQVREQGTGAALFGYTQALRAGAGRTGGYLRVPHADYGPIKVPEGPPDDRFVYLSDVLPTAWQAVRYAGVPGVDRWSCSGSARSATCAAGSPATAASTVIGIDLVTERLERRASGHDGARPARFDDSRHRRGRARPHRRPGPDAVIDAVGMEAHGAPLAAAAHKATALLPDAWSAEADADAPASTGSPRSSWPSSSSAAAGRCRSSASTAA